MYIFAGLLALTKVKGRVPVSVVYQNWGCNVKPSSVTYFPYQQRSAFTIDQCSNLDGGYSTKVTCGTGPPYAGFTDALFGGAPYLLLEMYTEGTDCGNFESAIVYPLDSVCHRKPQDTVCFVAMFNTVDHSIILVKGDCLYHMDWDSPVFTASSDVINSNTCFMNSMKVWTNHNSGSTTNRTMTTSRSARGSRPGHPPTSSLRWPSSS